METFVKNFIGKGKKLKDLEIVRVTLKLEEIERFQYQYGETKFLTFELAKMKSSDAYGRDYCAYVSTRAESSVTKEEVAEDSMSTVDISAEEQAVTVEQESPF